MYYRRIGNQVKILQRTRHCKQGAFTIATEDTNLLGRRESALNCKPGDLPKMFISLWDDGKVLRLKVSILGLFILLQNYLFAPRR